MKLDYNSVLREMHTSIRRRDIEPEDYPRVLKMCKNVLLETKHLVSCLEVAGHKNMYNLVSLACKNAHIIFAEKLDPIEYRDSKGRGFSEFDLMEVSLRDVKRQLREAEVTGTPAERLVKLSKLQG